MNKRILYESLYKAFNPKMVVVYSTINGIRMCKDESDMIDYDILTLVEPKEEVESKTWIEICDFSKVPHIIIKVNDFFVYYDLGEDITEIEKRNPSFRSLSSSDQIWVGKVYTTITQAFVNAGYKF